MTPSAAARPVVTMAASRGSTRAVALVLPGGRANSLAPTSARQLTGVRMRPFASALRRAGAADGLAVWSVRYLVRGWNGPASSPVADVRWVLASVRERHGAVPVVLVGHSMGGRTAMRVADDDTVVGVAGLAPWLPDGEPAEQLAGRRLLVVHGSLDRVTSPESSRRYVERARAAGAQASYVAVRGETHAMLLRPRLWHGLTAAFVLDALGLREMPDPVRRVIQRGTA